MFLTFMETPFNDPFETYEISARCGPPIAFKSPTLSHTLGEVDPTNQTGKSRS